MIAGQGTIGLEILKQAPDVDAVIVPIGGAGLVAGVSLALKTLAPGIKIIGVEPECAPSFTAAMKAGEPVRVAVRPTLADGLAVSCVGARAFSIARRLVDQHIQVTERHIALATLRLLELEKLDYDKQT